MSGQEKRKYPRFDVDARIQFKEIKNNDTQPSNGFVKDISAEGFCFASSKQLAQGGIIQLEITEKHMPDIPLCVKGEVVWIKKIPAPDNAQGRETYLTGVKILGIRDVDEARFAMLYCERVLAELRQYYRA